MTTERITIGTFSHLTYLSQRALRIYDQKGILVPEIKDRFTGYRYYSIKQIETALKIKMLSTLGFSLADVASILKAIDEGDDSSVMSAISRRSLEVTAEIERLKKITTLLTEKKDFSELFKMNVSKPQIKEVQALRILSKRETGGYQDVCCKLSEELAEVVFSPANKKNGVVATGPFFSICYDMEYRENDADIEFAIPIQGQPDVKEGMNIRNLPACKAASIIYKGPYEHEGFSVAFSTLFKFIEENNLKIVGPDRQIYLNNPHDTKPEDLLVEIVVPIE